MKEFEQEKITPYMSGTEWEIEDNEASFEFVQLCPTQQEYEKFMVEVNNSFIAVNKEIDKLNLIEYHAKQELIRKQALMQQCLLTLNSSTQAYGPTRTILPKPQYLNPPSFTKKNL